MFALAKVCSIELMGLWNRVVALKYNTQKDYVSAARSSSRSALAIVYSSDFGETSRIFWRAAEIKCKHNVYKVLAQVGT